MKQRIKRIRVTPLERRTIVSLYVSEQATLTQIARAISRPKTTVHTVLVKAGVWIPKNKPQTVSRPKPVEPPNPVKPVIVAPVVKRSILGRIIDWFR